MPALPGTVVNSRIVPTDSLDNYATHDAQFGRDGYRSVADIAERDAIYSSRRKEGMLVGVLSDAKIYQLVGGITNSNWQELQTGGGISGPYVTTVNGISGAVTIPVADFFLVDAQAMSASLISYTNIVSAGLQAQINSISVSGGVTLLTSVDNSVVITPISGGYDLSVTPAIISGGSTVFFGAVDLNAVDTEYTIDHISVDVASSVPVISVESPTNFLRYRIFDRAATSFKVALDATASATDKLLWHLATGTAEIGSFIVTENGDYLVDESGNKFVYA